MKKKLAVVLIISLLIAAMMPANVALAVTYTIDFGQTINLSDPLYADGDWIEVNTTETVTFLGGSGKRISIDCIESNANIVFENVDLESGEWGIRFTGGTNNTLTLIGISLLLSGDDFPTVYVPLDVELTIQNGETLPAKGQLIADGSEGGGTGIGSDYEDTGLSNKITINDVMVYAYGGDGCAGIGTAYNVTIGQITSNVILNNASVFAYGGEDAAGIGGGAGANGDVEIYDSSVVSYAGMDGAGIGGGIAYEVFPDTFLGGRGDVHIEGALSSIYSYGGRDGAGIGGGDNGDGFVNIVSGYVESYGGHPEQDDTPMFYEGDGAGIGGGGNGDGFVDIHGGAVYAIAGQREYATGAGIGGGVGGNGFVNIYGGEIWAQGGMDSAGIGGGVRQEPEPDVFIGGLGDVHIEGTPLIMAFGHRDGAGIGGGDNGDGYVDILGGEVIAYGGQPDESDEEYFHEGDGAGIGGGGHSNGYVNIHEGTVFAYAGLREYTTGSGIGGGRGGNGTINIYGGEIWAEGGMNSAGIGGGAGIYDGPVIFGTMGEGYQKPTDEILLKPAVSDDAVTIIGGTGTVHIEGEPLITAFGYGHGAGIGGGIYGDGIVDIYGGEVAALGGMDIPLLIEVGYGAGIGGGGTDEEGVDGGSGTVNIYDGDVNAMAQMAAAGIGGSVDAPGTVLIEGGYVEASGGYDAAGIGTGPLGAGVVTITGGRVEVYDMIEGCEAGIGSGYMGTGTVDISGGLVIARGGQEGDNGDFESAAGIGGGYGSAFGAVSITGGQVYAIAATSDAEDIGAALDGTCTGVNISGNSAVFLFGDNFPEATPITALEHMHIDEVNPNLQIVTANAAYGYTNFPDEWNTLEGYGYLKGYVVEFNHQDGSSNFETVWAGVPVPQPADPSRLGYIFNYWHTDMQGVNPYDFSLPVLDNMIIYAHWVEQGTHFGDIQGTLENPVGMPLEGYNITLQSQPVTVLTTNTGSFTFGSVFFINHTLIIQDDNGVELKRYSVTMTEGSSPGAVVNNNAGTIVVTYVGDTTSVTIPLMYDGSEVIVSGPVIVDGSGEIVNPRTGETGSNSFAVVLMALLILVSVGFIVRRKSAVNEK